MPEASRRTASSSKKPGSNEYPGDYAQGNEIPVDMYLHVYTAQLFQKKGIPAMLEGSSQNGIA